MSYRSLNSMFLCLFILAPGLGAAASASAAPRFLRLSMGDGEASTTMRVSWNSDAITDGSIVEYGLSPAYGKSVEGAATHVSDALGAVHEVELTGLFPNTLYHYRVGGVGGFSDDRAFRTADQPGCGPFRFVALGDSRSDDSYGPSPFWSPILEEALAHDPSFVINTGDLVKDGKEETQWLHFLETSEWAASQVPIMPCIGNHDNGEVEGDGALYNRLFSLPPNAATQTEDFYYFTHADAIVVSLSTETFDGGATQFEEQAAWLDAIFTEHPRTWKFVYFHHPVYTGVLGIPGLIELNHPPNEKGQNAALLPVFDAHHVDIVFNGHNHHYQRFAPMVGTDGSGWGVPVDNFEDGTVYVVTGGAGALTYDVPFIDLSGLLCEAPGSVACSGKHHFVRVEIDGLDLHFQAWSTAAQLFSDSQDNVALLDEFWIHKEGPLLACGESPEPGPDTGPEPGPELAPEPGPEPSVEPIPENAGDASDVTEAVDTPGGDDAATPPEAGSGEDDDGEPSPSPDGASGGEAQGSNIPGDGRGEAPPPSDQPVDDDGCAGYSTSASTQASLALFCLWLWVWRRRQRAC